MVHLNIFRKKKEKGSTKGQDHPTNSDSSGNYSSDVSSSFFSGESYDSSWDYDTDAGSTCSIATKEALADGVQSCVGASDLVKAFTQYISLEVQKTKQEIAQNVNKTGEDFDNAKKRTSEGFKYFQEGCVKSLNLDLDRAGKDDIVKEETPSKNSSTEKRSLDTSNLSIAERVEKRFEEWTDLAKNLEKRLAGDFISNETESFENTIVEVRTPVSPVSNRKKFTFDTEKTKNDEEAIEKSEPNQTKEAIIRRENLEKRDAAEPMTTSRKSRIKMLLSSPQHGAYYNMNRTGREGHSSAFKRTTSMSPRIENATVSHELVSTHKVEKIYMSPKKKFSTSRKLGKAARTDKIDEIVAHVLRKRSSESKFQNSENMFENDWIAFGADQEQSKASTAKIQNPFDEIQKKTDEKAAEKLRDAQKEIEVLKKLLSKKGDQKKFSSTMKPEIVSAVPPHPNDLVENDGSRKFRSIIKPKVATVVPRGPDVAPFDEAVPDDDLPSNNNSSSSSNSSNSSRSNNNKIVSTNGCKGSITYSQQSHCSDPLEPEAFLKFPPNHVPELNWDNFVGMDGRDDGVDEVSLLSHTLSPRRYGKGKGRRTPRGKRDMRIFEL